jgi:hypothetical protein
VVVWFRTGNRGEILGWSEAPKPLRISMFSLLWQQYVSKKVSKKDLLISFKGKMWMNPER